MRSAARIANSQRRLSDGPQATQKGVQDLTDWREIAWKVLEREEFASVLRRAVVSLPMKYREVLFLRDVKDLDTGETAWILNLTAVAVRARFLRARMQVYETLLTFLFSRAGEKLSANGYLYCAFRGTESATIR